MKKSLTATILSLLAAQSAFALDNETLKSTVVAAGILTNSFAIFNRNALDCKNNYQLGYQAAKDEELSSHSLNFSPMNCKLGAASLLPQSMTFEVLPTVLGSVWNADSGPYAKQAFSLALIPMGRYGLQIGSAIVDFSVGLGPTLVSETDIGTRQKSTVFQFTDEMGIGISDLNQRARLAFTYRHVSNADIKLPNNGVNFLGLGLTLKVD
jgi:hypothetical protein